jgi:hypothetical protein
MSPRDLAFVGCRLLALYILFGAVQSLAYNIYFIVGGLYFLQGQYSSEARTDKFIEAGLNFVPLAVGLSLFLLLWFRAAWLAGKIAANAPAEQENWSPRLVLSVAIIFFGLVVLYWTIPHLSSFLYTLATDGSPHASFLISILVGGGIGLGCILGSERIAGTIASLRRW